MRLLEINIVVIKDCVLPFYILAMPENIDRNAKK